MTLWQSKRARCDPSVRGVLGRPTCSGEGVLVGVRRNLSEAAAYARDPHYQRRLKAGDLNRLQLQATPPSSSKDGT